MVMCEDAGRVRDVLADATGCNRGLKSAVCHMWKSRSLFSSAGHGDQCLRRCDIMCGRCNAHQKSLAPAGWKLELS